MGTVVIGTVTYDIYGTHLGAAVLGVLSAEQYFYAALQGAPWASANQDTQKKALVTAARMFNRAPWQGTLDSPSQPLAWPRDGVVDASGTPVPDGETPLNIIYGSYELALSLIVDPTVQTTSTTGSNVQRQLNRDKVGDLEQEIETEYFRPTDKTSPRFPTIVQELVGQYLAAAATLVGIFTSGTDVESEFDDEDEKWGFTVPGIP